VSAWGRYWKLPSGAYHRQIRESSSSVVRLVTCEDEVRISNWKQHFVGRLRTIIGNICGMFLSISLTRCTVGTFRNSLRYRMQWLSCFVIERFWVQLWACRPTILTEVYRGLPQSIRANSGIVSQIRPRPLLSTFSNLFLTNYPTT
jgi:hypothetical protein